jgi:hypothetical protein
MVQSPMRMGIILARQPSGFDGRKCRVLRREARRAGRKLAGGVSHRNNAQNGIRPGRGGGERHHKYRSSYSTPLRFKSSRYSS